MIIEKWRVWELAKCVVFLEIPDQYDLAMLFCRIQEFHESPIPGVRGTHWTMDWFMREYVRYHEEECFTYPGDWGGFNLSKTVIDKFYETRPTYAEELPWDREFKRVTHALRNWYSNYYVIGGTNVNDSGLLRHELAHAFYSLRSDYKYAVDTVINAYPKHAAALIRKRLERKGYAGEVFNDEFNAYLCDGLDDVLTDGQRKNIKQSLIAALNELLDIQIKEYCHPAPKLQLNLSSQP